jgi:hypothetical protein
MVTPKLGPPCHHKLRITFERRSQFKRGQFLFVLFLRLLEAWSAQKVSYPVAVLALWAIELVYNAGKAICLDEGAHTPEDLRDCCQRWCSPDFGEYVRELKNLTD